MSKSLDAPVIVDGDDEVLVFQDVENDHSLISESSNDSEAEAECLPWERASEKTITEAEEAKLK